MASLGDTLERLGLSQYLQAFLDEGFDSWETLTDITESDLEILHVKLGHRRKLQRAIIDVKGQTRDNVSLGTPQNLNPKEETYRSEEESGPSMKDQKKAATHNGASNGGQKRKYRRHPKADEYAPERPPSAYVLFSNQMRDRLKGQDLSFTEIAKIVGERWQVLSVQEKEPCERQAQAMKEKYYADLTEYKKTPQYNLYQEYLAEFKAKHGQQENKKSRPGHEVPDTVRNESQDGVPHTQHSPPTPSNPHDLASNEWHGSASPPMLAQQNTNSSSISRRSPTITSPPVANFRRFTPGPASEEDGKSKESRHVLPIHQAYNGQNTRSTGDHRENTSPKTSHAHPQVYEKHYSPVSQRKVSGETFPPSVREEPPAGTPSDRSRGASPWVSPTYTLPAIDNNKINTSRVLPAPMLPYAGSLNLLMAARPLESSSSGPRHTSQKRNPRINSLDDISKSSIATLLRAGEQLDQGSAEASVVPDLRGRGRFWERD